MKGPVTHASAFGGLGAVAGVVYRVQVFKLSPETKMVAREQFNVSNVQQQLTLMGQLN